MTTTSAPAAPARAFTGTTVALRLILRLERTLLSVWIVATVALVAGVAFGIAALYPTAADRFSYGAATSTIVASHALNGPPVGLTSLGGIAVFEAGWYIALAVAALNIVVVARHSRGAEELGRLEMLRAGLFGTHANLAALLAVVVGTDLLVGAGAATALVVAGAGVEGAVVFGAALATVGVTFAAVTALAAQLTEHVRGTYAIAFSTLGVAFALRAIGDAGSVSFASWLSPLGWAQAAHAFADNRWWPLFLAWSVSGLLVVGAFSIEARRDHDAGLLRPRPGPAEGAPGLASAGALARRSYRGPAIGWVVAGVGLGAAFGVVGADAEQMAQSSAAALELMGGFTTGDLVDSYFAMAALFVAILASAGALVAVLRTRVEEDSGRADTVLATPVSRLRWLGSHVLVAGIVSALVLVGGGLGLGGAHALRTGEAGAVAEMAGAALAHLPAVWLFLAVAVALFGFAPARTSLVWILFAWSAVVTILGPTLRLPDAVQDLSPFEHTPRLPGTAVLGSVGSGASTSLVAVALLVIAAAVVAAAGCVGFDRRDVR
ncbi:ABC transporter permease [Rhodococcus triatomae]|uniref:ABC-2 type transport system permease protein n=1 Tax=Rhodococcus triatomae TaxID=300028 RepID=A0A1G7ZQ69_9NOCA|nr:hypothetical protein [Rhodococcus triatomae]QNG17979.1 ABC transporter permease [Rhodococcus triatomae]QNG22353.1 ABC transporter permease [Rhodococcus triatomae]SDH10863.1 ABC-2 type transport system permease protein [Rhodococcus triatomae]